MFLKRESAKQQLSKIIPEDLQVYLDFVYISDGSIQVTPRSDLQPHIKEFARKKCDVINDLVAGKTEQPIKSKDSNRKFNIKTKNKSPVYVYAPKQVDNSIHYHSHLHSRPLTRSGLHSRPPTGLHRPKMDHHRPVTRYRDRSDRIERYQDRRAISRCQTGYQRKTVNFDESALEAEKADNVEENDVYVDEVSNVEDQVVPDDEVQVDCEVIENDNDVTQDDYDVTNDYRMTRKLATTYQNHFGNAEVKFCGRKKSDEKI